MGAGYRCFAVSKKASANAQRNILSRCLFIRGNPPSESEEYRRSGDVGVLAGPLEEWQKDISCAISNQPPALLRASVEVKPPTRSCDPLLLN